MKDKESCRNCTERNDCKEWCLVPSTSSAERIRDFCDRYKDDRYICQGCGISDLSKFKKNHVCGKVR